MPQRPDPIPELKRQLACELVRAMHGWSMSDLRFVLPIDQPRVSDLRRGKLERFSVESLIRLLRAMGYRVELSTVRDR